MDIDFINHKLSKKLSEERKIDQEFGSVQAKKIKRRLSELRAVPNLAGLRSLPQVRCHELSNNRAGQLAVDLEHPSRLVFTPNHDPLPLLPTGGLDWTNVTKITINEIVDYHG